MSDLTDALALPPDDPYTPAWPLPPGYGVPTGSPPDEPSALWRLTRRHWKPLLACAAVSLAAAFLAGQFLGKPQWQADATLLYQPIALSEKQKAAYEHPPSLPTLAGWVKEPALLRQLIDEFHLDATAEELADRCLKVEQPPGTEAVTVTLKWPDPGAAKVILTRLLDLYADYVAANRKEAVLLRIEQMDRQAASGCEDEIKRLDRQVKALEEKLARTGALGDEDLDGSMLARRGDLRDTVRSQEQKLLEVRNDLRYKRQDVLLLRELVKAQAGRPVELTAAEQEVERLELAIKHANEKIDAAKEELRTLPIQVTRAKKYEQANKLQWLREQIKQHEASKAALSQPGGPPARGALEGMDAKEFSVKTPPRVGDKPASSSRKTLFAVTFLGLMAGAFGLLFAYDRYHPAGDAAGPRAGGPGRPRVHVTPPPTLNGVTITAMDADRLGVRIHHWVRRPAGPNHALPPLTIGPNGEVEDRPPPPPAVESDPEHLEQRMQQWLGDGRGPG